AGPNGNVWFTYALSRGIGRITRRSSGNFEYASLQPHYLCIGKHLRYSTLSVIGAIDEDVLVSGHARVDVGAMRLLAGRAVVDARAQRSRFHDEFPTIYQFVFSVIVADEVVPGLGEHFRTSSAPCDTTSLILPVPAARARRRPPRLC